MCGFVHLKLPIVTYIYADQKHPSTATLFEIYSVPVFATFLSHRVVDKKRRTYLFEFISHTLKKVWNVYFFHKSLLPHDEAIGSVARRRNRTAGNEEQRRERGYMNFDSDTP